MEDNLLGELLEIIAVFFKCKNRYFMKYQKMAIQLNMLWKIKLINLNWAKLIRSKKNNLIKKSKRVPTKLLK